MKQEFRTLSVFIMEPSFPKTSYSSLRKQQGKRKRGILSFAARGETSEDEVLNPAKRRSHYDHFCDQTRRAMNGKGQERIELIERFKPSMLLTKLGKPL